MKVFYMRRRWLTLIAGLLIIAAIFYVASVPAVLSTAASSRQLPIYSVETGEEKLVAISFDAAWGNEDTQHLIDIMDKYGIKATFFVVGSWVDKYPESVKALSDAGHDVMNHSDTHPHMPQLSTEEIISEIQTCNDKVAGVTGVSPTLIRLPYGDYDDKTISAVRSIGMEPIQWDVDSLDWKDLSADEITQRVLSGVKPGSIVLFHNAALHTPEALPGIIDSLQKDGYTFVKIADLIADGDYTIDHTGRQFSA